MREDSRREKRNRILDEAGKLFVRDGIDATKIIDIARASGVAKGTVYEYFDSKDEIVIEWIQSMIRDSQTKLQEILDEEMTTLQRMERLIDHMLEQSSRMRVTARLLMDAKCTEKLIKFHMASMSPERQEHNDVVADKLISVIIKNIRLDVGFIQEILRKGIEQGELKPDLNINFTSYIIINSIPFLSISRKSVFPEDILGMLAEKMGFEAFDWNSRDLCRMIFEGIGEPSSSIPE